MAKNASILIISDQHFPYAHPDIVAFLKSLKEKYKPDKVVNIGDEIDGHSISFHQHDPDLFSPSDELKTAINRMKPLYELFPEMDLLESNHGSLVYRKGKFSGLPRHVFKSYREILEAPKGWRWHPHLTLTMSNGEKVFFCHGKSSKPAALSKAMSISTVEGHYHNSFQIDYWIRDGKLAFSMHVGCLIDNESLAFSYNKVNILPPVIGCGIILNGQPKLLPLEQDKLGRWTGKVP